MDLVSEINVYIILFSYLCGLIANQENESNNVELP